MPNINTINKLNVHGIMLKLNMLYKLQHLSYADVFFFSCRYYRYFLKAYFRTESKCCSGYKNVGGRCERKHLLFVDFSSLLMIIAESVNLTGSNTYKVNNKSILKFTCTTTSFSFFGLHYNV